MERDDSEREGFVKVYGMWVPDSVSALELEMFHYYHSDEEWEWGSEGERLMVVGDCEKGVAGMSVDERRGLDHKLPRVEHFYNIVEMLVNRGEKVVERNRWLDEMVEGMISYDWCTLAGSGSSGKSFAAALVSVIDFICDPHESLCLITSTSIKGAQLRVWASVSRIWNRIPNRDDYGVMQMTDCRIRGFDRDGNPSNDVGLQIVAAGSGSEKEAEDKLIGIKSKNLSLVADELPNLPKKIVEIAETNLSSNQREGGGGFKMRSLGNPNLMGDAFGLVGEPKGGWKSVTEADKRWETDRGICIRFDAEDSPNIRLGETRFDWYPTKENIALAKKRYGEKSLQFYRQYKAFWFSGASTETVYTEGEIVAGEADRPYNEERDGEVMSETRVGGADPAYTQGGDIFPYALCRVVENVKGEVFFDLISITKLDDEIGDGKNRTKESALQLKNLSHRYGVIDENFGYDGTGAGISFGDMIAEQWSNLPINVMFGGAASEMRVGFNDDRMAKEVYANKVSEIWLRMKGMIANGRVRGLTSDVIEQMISRRWSLTRTGAKKEMVETKRVMKAREGYSPDLADALFIAFYVAIQNRLISVLESKKIDKRVGPQWKEANEKVDTLYEDMWLV